MTRARDLALTMPMPPADPLATEGPCTPSPFEIKSLTYSRPRQLPTSISNGSVTSESSTVSTNASEHSASSATSDEPQTPASAMAGLALSSCDVTPLSSPLISPPSVTGKRHRDEWTASQVQILENVLARPPLDLHFPPGSMPPPDVLDGLVNRILETMGCEPRDQVESSATSPSLSIANLDINCSFVDAWPHSWDETRHKLAALALADTRLGAELANRKLTRQERLARPGIRRVDSMDYLDDDDENQAMPSEKIGRVLRLSTTLQNSARGIEDPQAQRRGQSLGLSLGPAAPTTSVRSSSLESGSSSSSLATLRPSDALQPSDRPSGLVRTTSSLSVSSAGSVSRRPSLLARGRSFTASDLEAEASDEASDEDVTMTDTVMESPEALSHSVCITPDVPVAVHPARKNTPAVAVSGPSPPDEPSSDSRSPPHKRRVQGAMGRSKSHEPSQRDAHASRDSFLAPPIPAAPKVIAQDSSPRPPSPAPLSALGQGEGLGGAFEWSAPGTSKVPTGWESEDSDREGGMAMKKPRHKIRGTLAMTALNAAAGRSRSASASSGSGSGSSTSLTSARSRSTSLSTEGGSGASTPPLVVSTMVDEAALIRGGGLRSPFEERVVELA